MSDLVKRMRDVVGARRHSYPALETSVRDLVTEAADYIEEVLAQNFLLAGRDSDAEIGRLRAVLTKIADDRHSNGDETWGAELAQEALSTK